VLGTLTRFTRTRSSARCGAAVVWSTLTWLGVGANAVYAQAHSCANVAVEVTGDLDPRWSSELSRACAQLASHSDLDTSAHLRLFSFGSRPVPAHLPNPVQLTATLNDGRSAQRLVRTPQELSHTLEALLVLPPSPRADAEASAPEPAPGVEQSVDTEKPPALSGERAANSRAPSGLGWEISLDVAARLGRAPTYVGAAYELYAGLLPGDFWLGVMLRWEPVLHAAQSSVPSEHQLSMLSGGVLGAWRVLSGFVDVELGIDVLGSSASQHHDYYGREVSNNCFDIRTGPIVRVLLGEPHWRWVLSLGADIVPYRIARAGRHGSELPVVPVWSAGLSVGAAWERR
jgi:hypothetical protein